MRRSVSGARASAAAKKEAEVHAKLQNITNNTLKLTLRNVPELDALVDSAFKQHVLADLIWEQLVEFHSGRKNREEQVRLLTRRREFHAAAYDGLSGAHAWTLEAFGDAMITGLGDSQEKKTTSDTEAALELYKEAISILKLMFGDNHEYVTQVVDKCASLTA